MILPTYLTKIPQSSPKPPQRKNFLHELLVNRLRYLPGVCGWDIRDWYYIYRHEWLIFMVFMVGRSSRGILWVPSFWDSWRCFRTDYYMTDMWCSILLDLACQIIFDWHKYIACIVISGISLPHVENSWQADVLYLDHPTWNTCGSLWVLVLFFMCWVFSWRRTFRHSATKPVSCT